MVRMTIGRARRHWGNGPGAVCPRVCPSFNSPDAQRVHGVERAGRGDVQRVTRRESPLVHPLPQLAEVAELPADAGQQRLDLLAGEVVRSHKATVSRSRLIARGKVADSMS